MSGNSGYNKKKCILLPEDFFFYLNSVYLDEMQHDAAFHLGLHCLYMYLFRGSPSTKGLSKP